MSEPLSTDPYKGVRDFYLDEWARLGRIFGRIRKTLSLWGYEEYNASPLERAELYETKTSEEIVNEQTYTFVDRGDRAVTLRPEMTPTLARMVASKRRDLVFPLRWFSIGNRFRYERPQKGRLREFYQADIDIVGLPEGEADNEILELASAILKSFGAKGNDFIIRVNSRPLLSAACRTAGLVGEGVRQYLRLLDKKSRMPADEFAAASRALVSTDPFALIEQATEGSIAKEKRALADRIEFVRARGVENIVLDTSVTRGFDYYTGMVFEVFDTDPANPRSLFGGGRYDGLVALFGGDPIPAVGFAIGDVTLADFLETHGIVLEEGTGRPQLYLGTPGVSDIPAAQAFANELRARGCRVFVNLAKRALGDQVKEAVRRRIPFFAAYGIAERERKLVRLKTLASGEEYAFPPAEIPARVREAR